MRLLDNSNKMVYLILKQCGLVLRDLSFLTLKIFSLPFSWSLFRLGVRISDTPNLGNIGHLICEPLYIELLKRNNLTNGKYFIFLSKNIANPYLRGLLPKNNFFVKNPLLINILRLFTYFDKITINTHRALSAVDALDLFSLIDENLQARPFFKIAPRSDKQVNNLLTSLGVKESDWYVCLHIRTDAYLGHEKHRFRNSSFNNYLSAIKYIYSQGGKVVKVGEPDEFSNEKDSGVIHYENSIYRNPKNDVLINSHCSFFIGNTSGIQAVPGCLGIPIVAVNAAPLAACKIWGPQDIAIPKLYFNEKTKEIIGFRSVMNNPMGSFRYSAKFKEASISLIENSPEEILWAVEEMYEKVFLKRHNSFQKTQLQIDFDNLFNETHLAFYSKTLICAKFLEKYKDLIYK